LFFSESNGKNTRKYATVNRKKYSLYNILIRINVVIYITNARFCKLQKKVHSTRSRKW